MLIGSFSVAFNLVFNPRFPAMKSMSPSKSMSTGKVKFHHPGNLVTFDFSHFLVEGNKISIPPH